MSHIFISHVEEDAEIAREIATGLEAAGYSTWYYERDTVPGTSYLIQLTEAIERCRAVVLIVSPESIGSGQVTKEVVGAFERGKPFFPVLVGMTPPELKERQPEWRHALGGTAMITIGPEGVPVTVARIIDGLKALGIEPEATGGRTFAPHPAVTTPASYTPKHLADKILAARSSIEGERKQVTVLFADVTEFTSRSGKMDPEEELGLTRQCLEFMADEIHRYEGTIAQFLGDRVMALFGAPIAHEHAPQRALYAALGIQEHLRLYAVQLKEKGIEFDMRIGLNSGLVVMGNIGDDLTMEYTAIGDTVNLASRMESTAEPGTIQVAENTYRLTEGYFEFEPLGEVQVKGKEQPVQTYRVLGLGPVRTRLEAAAARGLTPFVGRERELELLLDGFERARAGRGQALSIMGEAGVGKSRLLYEFRNAIASEDVTFLEGKCLSYSRGVAYHPAIDLLKSNFNIRESDEDYQVRDKVKGGLKELGADEASTLPYLLELLSVKDSGIDQIPMSPESRKDRIMEALKRIVLSGSEIRPLIMAIEDLHWVDRSSEDTLKYLLESIPGARVLLIFTYRPEFVHTWGGRSYHSQVTLNRLSNRESLAMVAHLLGTEAIERELEELVLEKTEGVPFFIEEFIKSCKDLGIIERRDGAYCLAKDIRDVTIPSTIQDVIMARVDSLPEAARGVLQTGSVIEREFSYELIRKVAGISEQELLSHLSALKDSELLYERGIYPQSTYIFRHALTREVVYDSILTAKKNRLHVQIGDAIEETFKDSLDEHYEALAGHYVTGENYEKGAEYCQLAARKAQHAGSLIDAIAYGERRVACLERLPQTEDVEKKVVDARTALGLYYIPMNYHIEAKEAVDPIVELALERDYRSRVSQIYTIMGTYAHWVEEDFPMAFKYLEDGLKIAEELNDIVSLGWAGFFLSQALCYSCNFEKSLYHLEKVLEITVAANIPYQTSTIKSNISLNHYYQGKIDLAYQTSDEALLIAEESGDIYSKGEAHTAHGSCCYGKGLLDEAEQHLLKAVDYCERINLFSYGALATLCLGDTYFDMANYNKSQNCYSKSISLLESVGFTPSLANMDRIALARAKVANNEKDIDVNVLFKCYDHNKQKIFEGWMLRYIGEILLNIDDQHMTEAEDWIKSAIEADKRNGMMFHLGQDYAVYAELFKRKGDLSGAKENLNTAIAIYKECGADGWVTKAQEALARM